MENIILNAALESVLFAAERPVTVDKLQELFGQEGPSKKDIVAALEELTERYQSDSHGIELRAAQGGYQFTTKVENGALVRKFLESKPFRLGKSAMETLAIIAYRQPITRAEIDRVRGIDSSHLVRTLIERDIVRMTGKANDIPGKPVQYGTSQKFLDLVGLSSLDELPPLSELKELQGDQPSDERSVIEKGLDRFIDTSELLENRQVELEEGLATIDETIKAAGDPAREIYESEDEAQVAENNNEALRGFLEFARGKNWPKAVQHAGELDSGDDNFDETTEVEEVEISEVVSVDDLVAQKPEDQARTEAALDAAMDLVSDAPFEREEFEAEDEEPLPEVDLNQMEPTDIPNELN